MTLLRKALPVTDRCPYTRKHDVPFENRGRTVSAMRIKAIGTITGNHGDGKTVDVEWKELDPPREWFLYTYRTTIARARFEDDEMARQLVSFAFDGKEQNFASFLSHAYWAEKFAEDVEPLTAIEEEEQAGHEADAAPIEQYGVDDIIAEGGFLSRSALTNMISRLEAKKNLILQGAPGTGKTWLAKRLGKALIERRTPNPEQLRSVQFHPSLSYEDFVRGYRPSSNGLEHVGRIAERLETTEKANEIQRRMLEAAARRPRDRNELGEWLRDGRF
ncbi:AAA family ATPase [Antarcticimicrobium sp.]|uniref:AAA family ATPase n=1 Tax=Antarcticimicrobium sp. TaxID=2824147 RepID=UPI003457395A